MRNLIISEAQNGILNQNFVRFHHNNFNPHSLVIFARFIYFWEGKLISVYTNNSALTSQEIYITISFDCQQYSQIDVRA